MEKKLFRILLYLFILILPVTALFSKQLFYQNGNPSHPQVLGYSSSTRSIIDLAGDWEYTLDEGVSWQKIKLPSAADYDGKIVFRKKFIASIESINNNIFKFVSYGINYKSEIYINETFVGSHEGGYTSFELVIPENIIQVGSENVIRIVVDNTLDYHSTFPLNPQVSGWKNYNGISRDLFIVALPRVWIDKLDVSVEAIEPKSTRLLVSTNLSSKSLQAIATLNGKMFQLQAEVSDATASLGKTSPTTVDVGSGKEISGQISVTIPNAKLWSPDTPEQYTIKLSLTATDGKNDTLIDEASITTGIRTFIKDKNLLLFNGAPVKLKGVVWVEDTEKHGDAITYEEMERDVALIKNLGANTVRVGFHPPHPFFIQLCNRYGLFVLEEIPNFEIPSKILEEENYQTKIENYLKEVISRDKHNPSIIAWGLGEGSDISGDVLTHFHHAAKSIDDRLTYFITRNYKENLSITDIAAISSPNVNNKIFTSHLETFKDAFARHPILLTGYGKPVEKGNHNGYSDPNSQEAQGRYINQKFEAINGQNIAGAMIATFNDYRSERPILSVKPITFGIHTDGIVELNREKKVAYDVVHSLYHGQKVSALPVGSYVIPLPLEYVVIGLGLLVLAAWLVNGNRRYRESTRRAIFSSYNFFADIRDQFTLPLFHTTVTALIISATYSVIFSSVLHHYRSSTVLDFLLSYFLSDSIKIILIRMAWEPLLSIAYLSGFMMAWFIVCTFFIQIFSKMARVKIRWFHSYSIAVWTALPWAFFIPIGMILYRVLQSDPYVPWIVGIVIFTTFWVYLRTLKGISVIYNMYTPKMYMIGLVLFVVVTAGMFTYWDYTYSFSAYTDYFITSILPFVN